MEVSGQLHALAALSKGRRFIYQFPYTSYCTKYEGRTESHEHFFLLANWEQQTKESAMVDGTSCCVILECLVTSIACIT